MRIGVYIAGRNCASLAGACVASLKAQTFGDWVACIIDDASTDATRQVCREAIGDDPTIEIHTTDVRSHSCWNKLRAIRSVRCRVGPMDILVGLDLDDRLKPNALQRIHDVHEAGALVTYGNWEDQHGNVNRHEPMTAEKFGRIRLAQWFMTAPNTLRVGIFDLIPPEFWQWNNGGKYYETGFDGGLMYAAADLVGQEHVVGIADPIYVYNRLRDDSVLKKWPLAHRVKLFDEQRNKRRLEKLDSLPRPDGFAGGEISRKETSG